MNHAVYLQTRYQSTYSLLGAMAEQLAVALRSLGHTVHELSRATPAAEGTVVFFNTPASIDGLPPALFEPASPLRAVQILVDHPFAQPVCVFDHWHKRNRLENLRVCLPCADDVRLLSHRWPGMRHEWMRHAIPRTALCDHRELTTAGWSRRPHNIVLAGSIDTEAEINQALSKQSSDAQKTIRAIAAFMLRDPGLGYVQAADLITPEPRDWETDCVRWRMVNMIVNRARRTAVVNALQGLSAVVHGPEAWKPFCTGTITYAGNTAYADMPTALASARVAVAWGPTQFAHSYSERLMLAMAAGCAPISDDRHLVRRDFPEACAIYNAANPKTARAACEHLLSNPAQALELASRARAQAERECLWEHRVDQLLGSESLAAVRA